MIERLKRFFQGGGNYLRVVSTQKGGISNTKID